MCMCVQVCIFYMDTYAHIHECPRFIEDDETNIKNKLEKKVKLKFNNA